MPDLTSPLSIPSFVGCFLLAGRYEEVILHTHLSMKMEQTHCSETSAYKIQTLGNYPEESIQHSKQGESVKSRIPSFYHL